ncbi:hypothetical protein [Pseudomonas extremaustralis]
MSIDIKKLRALAEAATGFSNVTLAPDVVLELIYQNERLTKNYKSLCDSVAHLNAASTSAGDEVARLKAECEGLRLDAERYRWLRGRDLEAIHEGGVFAGQTPRNVVLNGEDLDAAIDAAIQAIEGVEVATVEGGVQAT